MIRRFETRHAVLGLVIVACLATPVLVQAGLLDKWLKKDGGEMSTRARFDLEPSLVFDAGELAVDLAGRWKLGASSLVFTEESLIRLDGREVDAANLRLGREARVTGYRLADGTVAVRRLTLESTRRQITEFGALEAGTTPVGELPTNEPN